MDGLIVMEVNFNDIKMVYEKEVKIHTKNKGKVYRFDRFKMENLTRIYDMLSNNEYKNFKYNIFLIKKPKYRIVMSLDITDKIINHYITRYILMPKLKRCLDDRNVATRKNLGRDYGIRLVKKYLEYYKIMDNCYVLKMDISKYFYRIDHNVLKNMIKNDLTLEEYELISMIIDCTNREYINKKIIELKNNELRYIKERIKEVEDIPIYEFGKGLPIGNMSSQFLSIFYLNRLDHKIIHDYRLKRYIRYMDDILIFSSDREYLKKVKEEIEKELRETYLLDVNKKKTFIVNAKNGFTFCGYRFRLIGKKTVINVCSYTKKRVSKRVKEVRYLYDNNLLSFEQVFSSINTYYNGFKYGSKKKIQRIVDKIFFG